MTKKIWTANLIIAIVIILMMILPLKAKSDTSNNYPNAGIITELDYENDIFYFTDFSGNVWSCYGIEDLLEGDIIAVIMSDIGKLNYIYDDAVIDVRYIGYAY